MNAANNLSNPSIIEYTEFYNVSLDHMDLMQEYYNWQNPGTFYCTDTYEFQFPVFPPTRKKTFGKIWNRTCVLLHHKQQLQPIDHRRLSESYLLQM